ncbi:AraC family transcriptional regulator [Acinetobacter gyllenbergii]|uniref:AraC family transcriptional regulator n=1 Tax=Acinetobacter gyllenbergii TaxID=134534 RepID=UPI0008069CFF|nr:AraC family transcriptional regulator [Acinetobacter gyllenbergii]OBY73261.1 AraC family transcriptional regulator [Acinetobacter gyllenbergii]
MRKQELGSTLVEARYDQQQMAQGTPILGLTSLLEAMQQQGYSLTELLAGTGISQDALNSAASHISPYQKLQLFKTIQRLTTDPLIGMRAGQKQRLSDFGVYGYALYASRNFQQAVEFGIRHIKLAAPVLKKTFSIQKQVAIFEGHEIIALGKLLPLVCEFWFSSMQSLIECVLEAPFQAKKLLLPYPAPEYAAEYEKVFRCPVEFDAEVMQWHFDLDWLDRPCPNANPITADMCQSFCERMLATDDNEQEPELVRTIRLILLDAVGSFPTAQQMADQLHLSKRTLYRRLADVDISYQEILDSTRRRLADEYLTTSLSIDEIAERLGFSDTSNFRKAYRNWVGISPNEYRLHKNNEIEFK